jgi:hypothetical protein
MGTDGSSAACLEDSLSACKESPMTIRPSPASFCLAALHSLMLDDALGASIRCTRGSLWITQHGDPRDVVLAPGERFTIDRGGVAVVTPLADSALVIDQPPAAPGWAAAWRRRLHRAHGELATPVRWAF